MKILGWLLVVVGLYLLLDHQPPLPLNHVDVGLGTAHLVHSIIGAVALIGAWFLLKSDKK